MHTAGMRKVCVCVVLILECLSVSICALLWGFGSEGQLCVLQMFVLSVCVCTRCVFVYCLCLWGCVLILPVTESLAHVSGCVWVCVVDACWECVCVPHVCVVCLC